jgi:hypothetical protein
VTVLEDVHAILNTFIEMTQRQMYVLDQVAARSDRIEAILDRLNIVLTEMHGQLKLRADRMVGQE